MSINEKISGYGKLFLLLLIMAVPAYSLSQAGSLSEIELAISKKDFSTASKILRSRTQNFIASQQADSLVEYVYVSGKIHAASGDDQAGRKAVEQIIAAIKSMKPRPAILKQAYIEAGVYFDYAGDYLDAYENNLKAWRYAMEAESTPSQLALIQNNLSTFSQRSGNLPGAKVHTLNAIHLLQTDPNPNYTTLYIAQNGMGAMMHYASKLDSAAYYYGAALVSLRKAPDNPVNRFYRPAIIQNNLSGIYSQQGNMGKAIEAVYSVIQNLEAFEKSDADPKKKSTSASFRFEAIDNLAGLYKSIGDLTKARELLEYSYQQKRNKPGPSNPGIFISQILLGQLYYAMRENDLAQNIILQGIENYLSGSHPDPIWLGEGYSTLALIDEDRKNPEQAAKHYNRADSFFREGLGDDYDETYLELLRNKALFYAQNGDSKQALSSAQKGYHYIEKTLGKESLAAFYQLLNFSSIEYTLQNYKQSELYATEGLQLLDKKIRNAGSLVDSIKMEVFKPQAILYKAKANYRLNKKKTVPELNALLAELNSAVEIIERKKSYVNDGDNNKIILSENKNLFDFIKEVELELYRLTGDKTHIDRIINQQESFLYSRIRSRLDGDTIKFANVPEKVRQEESRLNRLLENTLTGNAPGDALKDFKRTSEQILTFRSTLQKNYPGYYKLRYHSFLNDATPVESMIQPGITLVRYFYIDTSLFVLVADHQSKEIVPLKTINLRENIEQIYLQATDVKLVSDALYNLYDMLWKPVEKLVKNKKIVVIPDGILFSLNLELLTPQRINSFRELSQKSLLAHYNFSFQYSMFLMDKGYEQKKYTNTFSGFAPGFGSSAKQKYLSVMKDSLKMDYSYLNMLPQPFAASLLKKLKTMLGGKIYLNESCTKEQFIAGAAGSRIIHLGTHAFSDNQYPQYSRLIFSKDKEGSPDNVMYVHDIYRQELPSALTVLAACETGMPGYEDGEGMISLAHAFHYAGSQSILTSLWKVDEKASAVILEKFYGNLKKDVGKDEALRLAKLSYLKSEDGRMLNPAYWGGLVILGDTSPMPVEQEHNWMAIAGIIALSIFTILFVIRKYLHA